MMMMMKQTLGISFVGVAILVQLMFLPIGMSGSLLY
jgi:hypothetical protein